MIIYTALEMIEEFGESEVNRKIHRFKCDPEKSIERELRNRIIYSDKIRNTTTHFILDDLNDHEILAFFTLKIHRIDKALLCETMLEAESNDKFRSAYYIVFLARGDNVDPEIKAKLRGNDILDAAIEQIDDARNIVGGVNVVLIDAYTIKEKVCKIYEEYGFIKIPAIENTSIMSVM